MNAPFSPELLSFATFVASILGLFLFFSYTTLRRRQVPLAWLLALVFSVGCGLYRMRQAHGGPYHNRSDVMWSSFFIGLFVFFATAFAIRLYRKWLDGELTEDERAGGRRGMRAWLSPANLMVAALISLCAWQGLGWSLLLGAVVTVGALVLWPALHAEHAPVTPLPSPVIPSSAANEREKVLALLEAGKITADESAELLHALASASAPPATAKGPFPRSRRIALAGAMLVLVGFFLPWFRFSPMEQMAATISEMGIPKMPLEQMSGHSVMQHKVTIRGGDVADGLGWLVLILGVGAAVLPLVAQGLDVTTQRAARWIALGGGGIVVLYVISQDIRSLSIGLVLVLVGYVCQVVGLCQEQRSELVPTNPAPIDA